MVGTKNSLFHSKSGVLVVTAVIVITGIVSAALVRMMNSGPESGAERVQSELANPDIVVLPEEEPKPISEIWQRHHSEPETNTDGIDEGTNTTAAGLSRSGVYGIIGKIQYQGDRLVLDYDTKKLLESSFRKLGKQANAEQINEIQAMLKRTLPGTIGEQAAEVVGNYFEYQQVAESTDLDKIPVEENIHLREQYLGVKLNSRLYGKEQAYQRFLAAKAQIDGNQSLSDGERREQTSQLKQNLNDGVFFVGASTPQELHDVSALIESAPELDHYLTSQALALSAANKNTNSESSDWQQRYQQYDEQRRWVLEAAMTSDDKRKQLDRLYTEYFTKEERSKIDDYIDPDTTNFNRP